MNESCIIDNHRTIDTDKLSTQCTLNFLRDSVIFKDTKNKYFEEICPEKVFDQIKITMQKNKTSLSHLNESVLNQRNILFSRLRAIYKQLRLSNHTLHLAFYYFDNILSLGIPTNVSLENVAFGCLSLASKIIFLLKVKFFEFDENETLPLLDDLYRMFSNGIANHDLKEIKQFELFCVNQLNYKLNMVTPLMVVEFMMAQGIFINEEPKLMMNGKCDKDYSDPLLNLSTEIMIYVLEDFSYLEYSTIEIACGCIALIREITKNEIIWSKGLETVYKIKLKEFNSCFDFVRNKYYKNKNAKKTRDTSIGRKNTPMNKVAPPSNHTEVKPPKNVVKKVPIISPNSSTIVNAKILKHPNYIKIIKRGDKIPKPSKQSYKQIISPIGPNIKFKTSTNKTQLLIIKENYMKKNSNYIDVSNKKRESIQNRDRKFLEFRFNTSGTINKTFSHDRFVEIDNKYLNTFNKLKLNTMVNSMSNKDIHHTFIKKDKKHDSNDSNKNFSNPIHNNKKIMYYRHVNPNFNTDNIKTLSNNDMKVCKMTNTSRKSTLTSNPSVKNLQEHKLTYEAKVNANCIPSFPLKKYKSFTTKNNNASSARNSISSKNEMFDKKREEVLSK